MKYYVYSANIGRIEQLEYTLLAMVDCGRSNKSLTLCKTGHSGKGCIYEADEYFATYLKLTYDIDTVALSEDDYVNLMRDGAVFLTKELSKKLQAIWDKYDKLRYYA